MRLHTRLGLAFGTVALVATLLVSGVASLAIDSSFTSYVRDYQNARLGQWANVFTGYYLQYGTWEGAQNLVAAFRGGGQGRRGMGGPPAGTPSGPASGERVLLVDAAGEIVVDSYSQNLGEQLNQEELEQDGIPLQINGQQVGTLLLKVEQAPGLRTLEDKFFASVNRSVLWSGLLAALLAAGLGLYLAGRLTKPLEQLTQAAGKLAKGNLSQKVEVASRDEIGELAATFNRMAESLNRNEHLRRSLVADVAHELRTPLAVLRGNLESLLAGVMEPDEAILASLHDETLRMSYLVKDLQELSLAEAGQLRLNLEQTNVGQLVKKIAGALSLEAETKEIQLTAAIEDDLPEVTIDSSRIGQILANLVSNAVRYTPSGGAISVKASKTGEYLELKVEDTGPGLLVEDLPYIFERFYRGDKARARAEGGAGLGLAIAKGLVEAHGGTISAANRPQGGSVFTVVLPLG